MAATAISRSHPMKLTTVSMPTSAVTMLVLVLGLVSLVSVTVEAMPTKDYMEARKQLLEQDRNTTFGHTLVLNANEKIVSDAMVKEKKVMIEKSRIGKETYFPALSYFDSKPLMEKTNIYRLIQKMPKGGVLHLHDMAMTSLDWLVSNVTYRDNLYMCMDSTTKLLQFRFFNMAPINPDCPWKLVKAERFAAQDVNQFDLSLKNNISMLVTDPIAQYPTLTQIWTRFQAYFGQVAGLIFYGPVFKDYFYQGLTEFHEDNVQYVELRALMSPIYELDGSQHSTEYTFEQYRITLKEFVKNNPKFVGVKFIMSGVRAFPQNQILKGLKEAIELRKSYPDLMLGYDLVGQEDPNHTLMYYIDELLVPSQMNPTVDMPYYFHAAETNWQGTGTDYNLIDAVLLNATRIGHGYGLAKHPTLIKEVREKGIAVEINPISNQLLGLVKDPRNHALVPLLAQDFPLVVSSDDPIVWEAAPLSSDFYVAYMTMSGEDADLRFLKQLAINSFQYSGMRSDEKTAALKLWQSQWDAFIKVEADAIRRDQGTAC